jgi:hypothetical protein
MGIKPKLMPSPGILAAKTFPRAWPHFAINAKRNTEEQEPSAPALIVSIR